MPDLDAASPARLGGHYLLGPLLGRGGMADVHVATDERDGRRVALKLFRQPVPLGTEGQVRQREVRALEVMRHPCLVELLDVGGLTVRRPGGQGGHHGGGPGGAG